MITMGVLHSPVTDGAQQQQIAQYLATLVALFMRRPAQFVHSLN